MRDERDPADIGPELVRDERGLALVGAGMELRVDFAEMLPRVRQDRLGHELLVRAARVKGVEHPVAWDATAGLGEDSFLLAAAGFEVELYERDATMATLLRDGLERAAAEPELAKITCRMHLHETDSIAALEQLAASSDSAAGATPPSRREVDAPAWKTGAVPTLPKEVVAPMPQGKAGSDSAASMESQVASTEPIEHEGQLAAGAEPPAAASAVRPDVIYLDPMFPARSKSAAVKKKAQLMQMLEEPCSDEEACALVRAALAARPRKVVVKRPLKGPHLASIKPAYSVEGRSVRFDVLVV